MPRTSPYHIELTKDERDRLQASVRRYTSAYRDVTRAKIVLLAGDVTAPASSMPSAHQRILFTVARYAAVARLTQACFPVSRKQACPNPSGYSIRSVTLRFSAL